MKIQQDNLPYRPITIMLENREEAKAFLELIDKLDALKTNVQHDSIDHEDITAQQYELIKQLSDALFSQVITI